MLTDGKRIILSTLSSAEVPIAPLLSFWADREISTVKYVRSPNKMTARNNLSQSMASSGCVCFQIETVTEYIVCSDP